MLTDKLINRALSSIAIGLGIAATLFAYHIVMDLRTGYRFVLPPVGYAIIAGVNTFLLFLIQCMTASIKYEFSRKYALLPVRLIPVRIVFIAVAWVVILLAMGVWMNFFSLGGSILFIVVVIESGYFSVLKIWNFGR